MTSLTVHSTGRHGMALDVLSIAVLQASYNSLDGNPSVAFVMQGKFSRLLKLIRETFPTFDFGISVIYTSNWGCLEECNFLSKKVRSDRRSGRVCGSKKYAAVVGGIKVVAKKHYLPRATMTHPTVSCNVSWGTEKAMT